MPVRRSRFTFRAPHVPAASPLPPARASWSSEEKDFLLFLTKLHVGLTGAILALLVFLLGSKLKRLRRSKALRPKAGSLPSSLASSRHDLPGADFFGRESLYLVTCGSQKQLSGSPLFLDVASGSLDGRQKSGEGNAENLAFDRREAALFLPTKPQG